MRTKCFLVLVAIALLCVSCGRKATSESSPAGAITPDLEVANAARPGELLELAPHLVKGKQTVVEYYSDHCEPSRKMAKVMEFLASRRAELAIRKINIDRPGATDIDFESPLARQHDIHSVPAFRIFDAEGLLVAEGSQAKDMIREWYYDEQMPVDKLNGVADQYRKPADSSPSNP